MKAEDLIALIEYGRQQGREEAARRLRGIADTFLRIDERAICDALSNAAEVIGKPPMGEKGA